MHNWTPWGGAREREQMQGPRLTTAVNMQKNIYTPFSFTPTQTHGYWLVILSHLSAIS